jgi:hypothetical protein
VYRLSIVAPQGVLGCRPSVIKRRSVVPSYRQPWLGSGQVGKEDEENSLSTARWVPNPKKARDHNQRGSARTVSRPFAKWRKSCASHRRPAKSSSSSAQRQNRTGKALIAADRPPEEAAIGDSEATAQCNKKNRSGKRYSGHSRDRIGYRWNTDAYFAAVFLVPAALICGFTAIVRGQKASGAIGCFLGVIGLIGIIYVSQQISGVLGRATGGSPQIPRSNVFGKNAGTNLRT